MIIDEKKILSLLFLLFSLLNSSKEDNDWFYERNKKLFCPSRNSSCQVNITYNNPYTPMILGNYLERAILEPYHFIYLIFDLPKKPIQRSFYLEAYDIIKNENLISNGDCYKININMINEHELRIYKPVNNTIIQIKFLGLNPQFFMKVTIKLKRDLRIYFNGIILNYENSLNKSDIKELKDYNEESNQQTIKQNQRKTQAIEKANEILFKLFKKTLQTDFEFSQNIYTEIIPFPPFLLITITISVGYTDSTENYLEPEDDEITLTKFISFNGGIELDSDNFEIFDGNIEVDSLIFNIIQLFNKKVNDLLFTLGLGNDYFSLRISTSILNRYVSLTLSFLNPANKRIEYEIQIKIEITNRYVLELVLATQEALDGALNKAVEFDKKYGKDITSIIFAMIIVIIILTIVILVAGPIIGVVGGGFIIVINGVEKIIQSLNFHIPLGLPIQFFNSNLLN